MKRFLMLLVVVTALLTGNRAAQAATPQSMNYQGYLKSSAGVPYNGFRKLIFNIYNVSSGGSALWSETHPTVSVAKGQFSVTLGAGNPATPLALAFDVPYWIGVTVESDPEMTPRQPLTTAPYAFKAASALTVEDGAVTSPKIGIDCSEGGVLVYRSGGWRCGTITTFPNAAATCVGSVCGVSACTPGYGNCDQNVGNGCETTLHNNTQNCGVCGKVCAPGEPCVDGSCVTQGPPISQQISTVRLAAITCGQMPCAASLLVTGATVTYARAAFGSEPAGFYVQDDPQGPALFIESSAPVPSAGDRVNFTVTQVELRSDGPRATSISGYSVSGSGFDLSPLVQDLSSASDLVSNLAGYSEELVSMQMTIAGDYSVAGTGFIQFPVNTVGISGNPALKLRIAQSLPSLQDITTGCTIRMDRTPLGQSGPWTTALPTVRQGQELSIMSCPSPKVTSANAVDSTHITVNFDRVIAPASVISDGSQFSIAGLTVIGASVTASKAVTLVTTAQSSGFQYQITVANSVTDTIGDGIDPAANSALFTGAAAGLCSPTIVISQLYGGGGGIGSFYQSDFVELHNRSNVTASLNGWSIQYGSSAGTTWQSFSLQGTIAPWGYYLIQLGPVVPGTPLPTPDGISTINMSAASGKVALVQNTTVLAGACPVSSAIADLVGYGTTNCSEGSATSGLSTSTAAQRISSGCIDTNSNAADFLVGTPAPLNSAASGASCPCAN